jgi:hypothetical protein
MLRMDLYWLLRPLLGNDEEQAQRATSIIEVWSRSAHADVREEGIGGAVHDASDSSRQVARAAFMFHSFFRGDPHVAPAWA